MSIPGPTHSSASIVPRSSEVYNSPGAIFVTVRPNSAMISPAKPGILILRPFKSSRELISFLNHPPIWLPVLPPGKESTL